MSELYMSLYHVCTFIYVSMINCVCRTFFVCVFAFSSACEISEVPSHNHVVICV